MAWEISMSATGWAQVQANLEHMATTQHGREELARAIADQVFITASEDRDFSEAEDLSIAAFQNAMDLPGDVLADAVLNQISEINTCDNGGHAVWADADGGTTIPVSPIRGAEVVEF